eukprot:2169135-Pleurochrysis_carterae.AAC.1
MQCALLRSEVLASQHPFFALNWQYGSRLHDCALLYSVLGNGAAVVEPPHTHLIAPTLNLTLHVRSFTDRPRAAAVVSARTRAHARTHRRTR